MTTRVKCSTQISVLCSTRNGYSLAFDKRNDGEHHFWQMISRDTSRHGGTILVCYSTSPFELMLQRAKGNYILSMSLHLANVAITKISKQKCNFLSRKGYYIQIQKVILSSTRSGTLYLSKSAHRPIIKAEQSTKHFSVLGKTKITMKFN